jgi:GntR family transcriptional regulator
VLPIYLDYSSGVPIYIQVKEALKNAVRTGTYSNGAQLPTVRQMAVQLTINANTVARAYSELEREGVISTQQGRGTFVTLSQNVDYNKLSKLHQMTKKLLQDAQKLGFQSEDIVAMIENIRHKPGYYEEKEV